MRPPRAVFLLVALASPASGQARTRPAIADSSAPRIIAHVGIEANAVWLRNILRQADAVYPQAKLDQIADSLVARSIDPRGTEPKTELHMRAVNAVNALAMAGASASLGGRPYAGALDRLITVHRQARPRDIRARALGGLLVISADRPRAVDYLRRVAASSDPTAYDAVEFLITDANGGSSAGVQPTAAQQQGSVTALKGLAAGHHVTNQPAANLLELWIQRYKSLHPSDSGR